MRFVLTALLWLVTTVPLAVAVPAAWAQQNVVDADGYAGFAQRAAADPALQQAMAAELTTQLVNLAANSGYDDRPNCSAAAATAYTRSSAFPGQFATVEPVRAPVDVHRRGVQQSDSQGRWVVDLGPMLADSSFQQTLQDFGIKAPTSWRCRSLTRSAGVAAARTVAAGGDLGSVGQRGGDRAGRRVRAADLGRWRAVAVKPLRRLGFPH